jgi:hypothetical protein
MAGGKTVREFKPRKYDLMPEFFEAFNLLIKHCNAQVDGVGASSTGGTPVVLDGAPEATPEGDDLAALPRSGV